MDAYHIEQLLRRDDLTAREREVDVLDLVDSPWSRGSLDPVDVVLVSVGDGHPWQALQETDDINDNGDPVFIYVPLSFGPVRPEDAGSYRCAGRGCTGLPYRARDIAHPFSCAVDSEQLEAVRS